MIVDSLLYITFDFNNGVWVTFTALGYLRTTLIVSPKSYVLSTDDDDTFFASIPDASIIILLFVSNAPVVPDGGKTNETSTLKTLSLILLPPFIWRNEKSNCLPLVVSDGWTR